MTEDMLEQQAEVLAKWVCFVWMLSYCGDLTLLQNGEAMYIPVTQEPSPMIEDMLEQQAEVLAKWVCFVCLNAEYFYLGPIPFLT